MKSGLYTSTIGKVLRWAQSGSLWYFTAGTGCCADEVFETFGCRYDLERYGCIPQVNPSQSDLLIVTGAISYKLSTELQELYHAMLEPKYVMSIGSCSNSGGAFGPQVSYHSVPGVDRLIPVDVYVPGCPPRPEAIMNGLIALQEKIIGKHRTA